MDDELVARFWSRVDKRGPTECWNWLRGRMGDGYGTFYLAKNSYTLTHRFAYLLTHGNVPALLRHTCDNRICVNPLHLLPGTHADNCADKVSRNRQARGACSGRAVLTEAKVLELRRRNQAGETIVSLARELGINQNTAYFAATGRSWKHI